MACLEELQWASPPLFTMACPLVVVFCMFPHLPWYGRRSTWECVVSHFAFSSFFQRVDRWMTPHLVSVDPSHLEEWDG